MDHHLRRRNGQWKREGQARQCMRSTSTSAFTMVVGTEAINQQNQRRSEVWLEHWQFWGPRTFPSRRSCSEACERAGKCPGAGAARDNVARLEQTIGAMGNWTRAGRLGCGVEEGAERVPRASFGSPDPSPRRIKFHRKGEEEN